MDPEAYSTTSSSDISRIQLLKAIKNKFYIHKSFDFQSDLEFLPSLPIDASKKNQITNNHLDMMHNNIRNDYYGSNIFDYGQKINIGVTTPKARSAIMSHSPKRHNGIPSNSRRKISQHNSNINPQNMRPMGNGHSQHMANYTNMGGRNW